MLAVAVVLLTVVGAALPARAWVYPVGPPGGPADLARGFDPPGQPWLSGHRGVDLRAPVGAEARAAGPGEVTYAGMLAGRGVVVVQHDNLRTTYEPVDAKVTVGSTVAAGEQLGTVAGTSGHCAPESCLHWGAIDGDGYVDPLSLVRGREVRLLPLGRRALTGEPPAPPGDRSPADGLRWPVADPYLTSPYGMRTHPITGERKLHDGTDFRAPCGTPIRAAGAGRVTASGRRGAYGLQVTVDHGSVGGTVLTTSYSHLSRSRVEPGQRVRPGQLVGWSGTTGLSTGCHLHFMIYAGGSLDDPMRWLPDGPSATRAGKQVHSLAR